MQRAHNHQVVKRQTTNSISIPAVGGFSGGATETAGVNLGSTLLLGSTRASASAPAATDPLVPGQATITLVSSSAPTQTNASSSSSSGHSSASISTGAIVGITVGVFLVVIGSMFAIYTYFKRRTLSRTRHTVARGPPSAVRGAEGARDPGRERQWNQKGGSDRGEGKAKSSPGFSGRKRPDSSNLALFEKDLSVRSASDEKVTASENHDFDPSSMPNFAKHHPYLADTSTLPPSHPEGSTVVSWDGSVASGDPLLSLHAPASDTMSPTAVIARQTPQAIDSAQHRWESAEVLIMDETTAERPSVYSDASQNPFDDSSAPRPSIGDKDSDSRAGRNPFFNASQHNPFSDRSTRSRKSSISTAKRSRTNSVSSAGTVRPPASESALLSLIAALNNPLAASEEQTTRTSMQTVTTSIYAATEPDSPMQAPKAF